MSKKTVLVSLSQPISIDSGQGSIKHGITVYWSYNSIVLFSLDDETNLRELCSHCTKVVYKSKRGKLPARQNHTVDELLATSHDRQTSDVNNVSSDAGSSASHNHPSASILTIVTSPLMVSCLSVN